MSYQEHSGIIRNGIDDDGILQGACLPTAPRSEWEAIIEKQLGSPLSDGEINLRDRLRRKGWPATSVVTEIQRTRDIIHAD